MYIHGSISLTKHSKNKDVKGKSGFFHKVSKEDNQSSSYTMLMGFFMLEPK